MVPNQALLVHYIFIFCFLYPKCVIAASNDDEFDAKTKVPVVQQKGRFKVTSESVGLEKVELQF